jgi:two-component system response regulator YesN
MDPRISAVLFTIQSGGGAMTFRLMEESMRLGLSEPHLSRLFRREVGTTFRRYLRDVRMKKAAELLVDPATPIKTIALDIGYSNVCNFYHDFRAVHGVSPKQFRLSHLGDRLTLSRRAAS